MKLKVYDELPGVARGATYQLIYDAAIDDACEHEPKWIRVDELGAENPATASGRARSLYKAAQRYAARTGLNGFEVAQRRVDDKSYPFIRKQGTK